MKSELAESVDKHGTWIDMDSGLARIMIFYSSWIDKNLDLHESYFDMDTGFGFFRELRTLYVGKIFGLVLFLDW